jgi:hypothetical protein
MHITRMSVAIPMRVPLNKYQTIYFIMNSSAMPHWLHQLLTWDVDQIHKISSKLRANSCTKVCSHSFCCTSRRKRQTQSWYRLVLYGHSCDIATNLPPHNPDSSFPIGNKLYGFKRHTNIQACLQGPYNNWRWPTQRSKWPVKASRMWLTFFSLRKPLTYQRHLQRRTPTTAQILEAIWATSWKTLVGQFQYISNRQWSSAGREITLMSIEKCPYSGSRKAEQG